MFRNIYIKIQSNLGAEILKLSNKELETNGSCAFIQRLVGDTKSISTIFTDISTYINGIISNIGVLVTYYVLNKAMFIFVLFAAGIRFIIETWRISTYNKNEKSFRITNDAMTGFTIEYLKCLKISMKKKASVIFT